MECTYGYNQATKSCELSVVGLIPDAKNMIGKTKWYLGGVSSYQISSGKFYTYERSNNVYSGRETNSSCSLSKT